MLTVWVTEAARTQATEVMLAASGVPTNKLWPFRTVAGAEVMVGRGPANR